MKDIEPIKWLRLKKDFKKKSIKYLKERYNVTLTGKAFVFEKGTHYLVQFSFAIILISLLMAYLFRSLK
jgi:hypothetical protein